MIALFKGRVYKEGKLWLIEVRALDLMTQGRTKEEAYEMLVDLLKTATNRKGLKTDIARHINNTFILGARDEQSERDLIALMLRRHRIRSNLSLSDMTRLLQAKSKNTYARYEHGDSVPSPLTIVKIFKAMGLEFEMRVRDKDSEEITAY